MANSLRLLQIVLLAVCSMVLTSALTCDKLILDATTIGEIGVSNDIMEMGRYKVSTTKPRNTNKIQALMATLNGASRIRGKLKSRRFSAILQPTDLKKLCSSPFVRSIKEVEDMDNTPKCDKLIKGSDGFVAHTSYIVMIKQNENMSEIMPIIISASSD
ncbi:uncharacterized protein, partial [Dysidea avara]|uniref:uncharacterized protein n=1 Tax=Dysidea avara TaxID=196820 RepID=UPI00332A7C91